MYGATLDSFPPHRVKVLDEGVDKITYDSSTFFINDCSYTPDSLYCLVIGTDISDVSSVTIEFESYQESSILLNEIEFYSNGFPLNFQTEQIDNEGNILTTPPIQTTTTTPPIQTTTTTPPVQTTTTTTTTTTPPVQTTTTTTTTTTTNMQMPPPTNPNPPPIENTETPVTADPSPMGGGEQPPPLPPPQAPDEIFGLASPSTIISIFLCLTCAVISSLSVFLITFCWFFLVKYKLRYEVAKKELDKQKTTQDVLTKTSGVHSNHYPELVFQQFADNTVVRPQVSPSVDQLQVKPPLPNNHPPSNSYYSQERIYEAIPAQQRRFSKSSSLYEVEEVNDYTLEGYTTLQGHSSNTNPFSKASMTSSQGGDNSNLISIKEAAMKEEGYMSMSGAV